MYYTKYYLEDLAEQINKKYYPERLDKVSPLDTYDLMEKLNLEVEWKYISPNSDLLGMIFFEDSTWFVWEKGTYTKGDIPKPESFKKGTIVINNILIKKHDEEKERFVSGHEIMHWIKDKEYFEKSTSNGLHICDNGAFNSTCWNQEMGELDIIERQTNYLNAAVLMPKELIKKEFFRRLRYKNIPLLPLKEERYMIFVLKDLAKSFGLNLSPIRYRLYDLNILERNTEVFNK